MDGNGANGIRLARLNLLNYRNFRELDLALTPGLTVIQGMNGQGKSNLLEAVYVLSVARSPRASYDRELIAWELIDSGGHAQIGGTARDEELTVKVQIDFEAAELDAIADPGMNGARSGGTPSSLRKSLRVNGIARPAGEFVGAFNAVAFAAEDIELITGGPAKRRRYLDILISQGDPGYLRTLQRYGKVVTQRNHLLRQVRERTASTDELAFWDERLCHEGALIVGKRMLAVQRLAELAPREHEALAGEGEVLGIHYRPRIDEEPPMKLPPRGDVAAIMAGSLVRLRGREIGQGVTVLGPHRDELDVTLSGQAAGQYASRGQARTIALALRLAEASFISDATDRKPVVILDDVLSELDSRRRRLVLEASSSYEQVLLTTTDFDIVEDDFLQGASRLAIADGVVSTL